MMAIRYSEHRIAPSLVRRSSVGFPTCIWWSRSFDRSTRPLPPNDLLRKVVAHRATIALPDTHNPATNWRGSKRWLQAPSYRRRWNYARLWSPSPRLEDTSLRSWRSRYLVAPSSDFLLICPAQALQEMFARRLQRRVGRRANRLVLPDHQPQKSTEMSVGP